MTTREEFGAWLAGERRRLRVSLGAVARHAGVSDETVRAAEMGKPIRPQTRDAIEDAVSVISALHQAVDPADYGRRIAALEATVADLVATSGERTAATASAESRDASPPAQPFSSTDQERLAALEEGMARLLTDLLRERKASRPQGGQGRGAAQADPAPGDKPRHRSSRTPLPEVR